MTRVHALTVLGLALFMTAAAAQLAPTGGTALAATQHVAVQNNLYIPAAITINVGDTVQWDWPAAPNAIPHTVTSVSPSTELDSGSPQATGTYSHTFSTAGTYDYLCVVHGTAMSGTVTVQQAASTATGTAPAATNTATRTATRTGTTTAVATSTVVMTSTPIVTPTQASGPVPTQAPPRPTSTSIGGAPGAGQQLPRAGSGPDQGAVSGWLTVVLAVAGLSAITAAGVIRRRARAQDS